MPRLASRSPATTSMTFLTCARVLMKRWSEADGPPCKRCARTWLPMRCSKHCSRWVWRSLRHAGSSRTDPDYENPDCAASQRLKQRLPERRGARIARRDERRVLDTRANAASRDASPLWSEADGDASQHALGRVGDGDLVQHRALAFLVVEVADGQQ